MKEKVCTSVLGILESDESRSRGLIGIWTVTFGWMLGVTYPLWRSDVQFPQIPSCSFASQLPANLDQIFFLALLVTLSILAAVNLFGLDRLRIDLLKRNRSWFVRLTAGFALALVNHGRARTTVTADTAVISKAYPAYLPADSAAKFDSLELWSGGRPGDVVMGDTVSWDVEPDGVAVVTLNPDC